MKKFVVALILMYATLTIAIRFSSAGIYIILASLILAMAVFFKTTSRRGGKSEIARMRQAARAVRWKRMSYTEASQHFQVSEKAIRRFNHFSFLYLE